MIFPTLFLNICIQCDALRSEQFLRRCWSLDSVKMTFRDKINRGVEWGGAAGHVAPPPGDLGGGGVAVPTWLLISLDFGAYICMIFEGQLRKLCICIVINFAKK